MQIKSLDQLSLHVYQQVSAQLAEIQTPDKKIATLLVGYSGGLDSGVLLHLLSSLRVQLENIKISAIHVNHGIHEASAEWARFCQQFCDELGIPLHISRHQLNSVETNREAAYRQLRYQVFRDNMPEKGMLLTAHHKHDQAETILFNLFRGAGLRGLGAMKQCVAFGRGMHVRPLLSVPHHLLREYAVNRSLSWIDDPSNADTDLDRNYIRHQILPVIEQRWPSVQACISRSGENLIQSEQIIDEVGSQDVKSCTQSSYPGVIDNAYLAVLNLGRLHQLSSARQRNLLRHWILTNTSLNISTDQLHQISQDLCAESASGLFQLKGYQLRVYKDSLYLMQPMPCPLRIIEMPLIENGSYIFKNLSLRIQVKGKSKMLPYTQQDVDLIFARRKGGEKIRHHGQHQKLKSIYQHYSVPPWERNLVPLIYHDDRLIAVPGVVLADDCPFDGFSISKYTADMA